MRARSFHFARDAALQHAGTRAVEQTMQYAVNPSQMQYAANPVQMMAQVTRECQYTHAVCQKHSLQSFGTANTTKPQEGGGGTVCVSDALEGVGKGRARGWRADPC